MPGSSSSATSASRRWVWVGGWAVGGWAGGGEGGQPGHRPRPARLPLRLPRPFASPPPPQVDACTRGSPPCTQLADETLLHHDLAAMFWVALKHSSLRTAVPNRCARGRAGGGAGRAGGGRVCSYVHRRGLERCAAHAVANGNPLATIAAPPTYAPSPPHPPNAGR